MYIHKLKDAVQMVSEEAKDLDYVHKLYIIINCYTSTTKYLELLE